MRCHSYMGEEADPIKLDVCAGWESTQCHEREDEESYPCDEIKGDDEHPNEYWMRINIKFLPGRFILLRDESSKGE